MSFKLSLVALRTGTLPLFFVPSLGRFTSAADDLYINADIFTLSFFFVQYFALRTYVVIYCMLQYDILGH